MIPRITDIEMILESIGIIRVSMPLVYPFRTACGDDDTNESILVRFASGNSYGWGESASGKEPTYSPECGITQFVLSRDIIAPLLLGQNISSGQELQKRLSGIKGNYFAKAAFDLAWWDLYARMLGKPLWMVLGGRKRTVDAGADLGIMGNLDQLLEAIGTAVKQEYKRIKLKCRPGWDLGMVDTVRKVYPETIMHIDCNGAYSLQDMDMFKKIDGYNLAMIEQPLGHDDLIDHAELQAHIKTPICLDESITSPENARKAIQVKACRWINIKPGRVGGITHSLAIHNFCMKSGIPCWIGGMLESAVGASHCLALATLPNIRYPSDIFPSERFYGRDLAVPPMQHSAPSQFKASMIPGIGVEPDTEMLIECARDRIVLSV